MYDDKITYRPPVEADTMLLQVTVGCTHNQCSYCSMYKDLSFKVVDMEQIEKDLQSARTVHSAAERIFLTDGDTFTLPTAQLKEVSAKVREYFPECQTLTMYCSIRSILTKSDEDLAELKTAGYNDFYIGIESGSAHVLERMNKGTTPDQAKEQLQRLNQAGINHNALIILGIAGKDQCLENARVTAEFINSTQPKLIWAGTLGVFEGTTLYDELRSGQFTQATELEVLEEEKELIRNIELPDVPFYGTHTTNIIPISGIISDDREHMINIIDLGMNHFGASNLSTTFARDRASL